MSSTQMRTPHARRARAGLATRLISWLPLAAALQACGGGGGTPNTDPPRDPSALSQAPAQPATGVGGQWPPAVQATTATACAGPLTGSGRTYHVGPGQALTELHDVPWLSLQAGDVVNVHHRATPYRTVIGLRAQGSATAPVVIHGVTSADCQRPVISGDGARVAADAARLGFGRDLIGAGLIQIWRLPTDPSDTHTARHIVIQNLKLVDARRDKSFIDHDGVTRSFGDFSAAVYAVRVHDLTVENCEITGNGLGVFTNSRGQSAADHSANVVIRRNQIHLNGNPDRFTEHNLYIQARRALYEGNFIGQSFGGSSLKDRSSGTVIRYNHIVASARALDLVETEEEVHTTVGSDPLYPHAWVYGNVIVNDASEPAGHAVNLVHWGHDNDVSKARNGTLYFYRNTLVNRVSQSQFWYTVPFQIGTDGVTRAGTTVEAFDNVFWQQGSSEWRFLSSVGTLRLRGTNLVPTGWHPTSPVSSADVRIEGPLVNTLNAQLDSAFQPQAGSPVIARAGAQPSTLPTGVAAEHLGVTHQPRVRQTDTQAGVDARPDAGRTLRDLGAIGRP